MRRAVTRALVLVDPVGANQTRLRNIGAHRVSLQQYKRIGWVIKGFWVVFERCADHVATLKIDFDFQHVGMHRHNAPSRAGGRVGAVGRLAAGKVDILDRREIYVLLSVAYHCHLVRGVGCRRFCLYHGHCGERCFLLVGAKSGPLP